LIIRIGAADLATTSYSPKEKPSLRIDVSSSPNKNFNVKDLLRAQIEEKKLLGLKERLLDKDYMDSIQKREKFADETDFNNKLKFKQRKDNYLKDLRQQIKDQHDNKVNDMGMNEREFKINKQKLKQMIKNDPERHRRKAMRAEAIRSRNVEMQQSKPQTFDVRNDYSGDQDEQTKTLDLTKQVKMPEISRKEKTIVPSTYDQETQLPQNHRTQNRTPSISSRNYHYAKHNTNITHRLNTKSSQNIELQHGRLNINQTYSDQKPRKPLTNPQPSRTRVSCPTRTCPLSKSIVCPKLQLGRSTASLPTSEI